ncbi:MAG: MBL fold metallo-hydrolase [Chloroflexi bacterium]|nr:MBL fold metallo-hydrolase [Chloroflexota bacterium]
MMDNGVYLIFDPATGDAAVVDPAMESERVWDVVQTGGLTLKYVLNTHGHFDHTFNNAFFLERSNALLLIHEADLFLLEQMAQSGQRWGMPVTPSPRPDGYLQDGQIITLGEDTTIEVRHTPGHTPGSVSFVIARGVVAGDTLFAGSIGRFDGPGSSGRVLIAAVTSKLFPLPDETVVYPGHGDTTTIGREKRTNRFFQAGAERYITH